MSCERKRKYDKKGAQTALNAFAKRRGRHGAPDRLRIYPCPECGAFHLTKKL